MRKLIVILYEHYAMSVPKYYGEDTIQAEYELKRLLTCYPQN